MVFRWTLASFTAALVLFNAGTARADDEAEFRNLCEEDTTAEKCDCYLGSLQEVLTQQDYQALVTAIVTNAKARGDGIELSPQFVSIDEDSQAFQSRATRATDHGLTVCGIDYHE